MLENWKFVFEVTKITCFQGHRSAGYKAVHCCVWESKLMGFLNKSCSVDISTYMNFTKFASVKMSCPNELRLHSFISFITCRVFPVWLFGGLSVALISLSGIFGAVLWPIFNSPYYPHVMRVLIGLAVGSLSSTAIFQLIPEVIIFYFRNHSLTKVSITLSIIATRWVEMIISSIYSSRWSSVWTNSRLNARV